MPKTDRTRPFSPLFAGRCRGRCLCRNWFGLPPEDDRICHSGRNAVERRNLSALFAVRSGRPETCHVRTQTNDYHCAQRTTVSALHRRRNQIGRRFERPERACKTAQSFVPAQGEPPSDPDRGALRTLLAPPFVTKRWLNPLLAGNAESKVRNFPEESIGEFIFS